MMNTLEAITLIEDTPDVSEEQYIAAFQSLIDAGVVWQLQGWYGRTARHLIDAGYCTTRNQQIHQSE
tara:strand:+ start:318 stop:518 length:201 start_codon:yes stop_codon:yes gene_type:complete